MGRGAYRHRGAAQQADGADEVRAGDGNRDPRSSSAVFYGHSTATGVRGWKRVAWICSWIAPSSFVLAALAIGLAMASNRGVLLGGHFNTLVLIAFVCGSIGGVAHLLLVYQVHRRLGLSADESSKLAALLHFNVGYSEWREAIRRDETAR